MDVKYYPMKYKYMTHFDASDLYAFYIENDPLRPQDARIAFYSSIVRVREPDLVVKTRLSDLVAVFPVSKMKPSNKKQDLEYIELMRREPEYLYFLLFRNHSKKNIIDVYEKLKRLGK